MEENEIVCWNCKLKNKLEKKEKQIHVIRENGKKSDKWLPLWYCYRCGVWTNKDGDCAKPVPYKKLIEITRFTDLGLKGQYQERLVFK